MKKMMIDLTIATGLFATLVCATVLVYVHQLKIISGWFNGQ